MIKRGTACMLFMIAAVCAACLPHANVASDENACGAACENLRHLGCEEGNPIDMYKRCLDTTECAPGQRCSANGTCMVTCVEFCTIVVKQYAWADPSCVSRINACWQIHDCPAPPSPVTKP